MVLPGPLRVAALDSASRRSGTWPGSAGSGWGDRGMVGWAGGQREGRWVAAHRNGREWTERHMGGRGWRIL